MHQTLTQEPQETTIPAMLEELVGWYGDHAAEKIAVKIGTTFASVHRWRKGIKPQPYFREKITGLWRREKQKRLKAFNDALAGKE